MTSVFLQKCVICELALVGASVESCALGVEFCDDVT
jgi:hypothetical protein